MKKIDLKFLYSFFFFIEIFSCHWAMASPYGFSKHSLSTRFESSYFFTRSNFDVSGNTVNLPAGNEFTEVRFDLGAAYDLTDSLEFYSEAAFKREDAIKSIFPSGTNETTNTNFSDVLLGANFRLWSGYIHLIPDVSILIPTYSAPGTDTNPLLGNGAFEMTAKLFATKQWRKVLIAAYGGFTYRTQGLNSQIPYGFLAHLDWHPIFFEGRVSGAGSLNNDQYQSNPVPRLAVDNTNDAGSFIYNSVNPTWLNGGLSLGLKMTPNFYATLGVDQTLTGGDIAQGTRFLVAIGYQTAMPRFPGSPSRELTDHDDNGNFEVDTDTEDSFVPVTGDEITPESKPRHKATPPPR